MLRAIFKNEGKPSFIAKAASAMTRGAVVTSDFVTGEVALATGTSDLYVVDVVKKYTGLNSIVNPTELEFEDIAEDDNVTFEPWYPGDVYATSELTATGLTAGASYLKAADGKFVAGVTADVCNYLYLGTYADATGVTLYQVIKVDAHTVA